MSDFLLTNLNEEEKALFLAEVDEHLQTLDECLLQMEEAGADPDLLNRVFRSAHTIKGAAATAGVAPMAELAHAMEDLLDRIRRGEMAVTTEVVDDLLQALDRLKGIRSALARGEPLSQSGELGRSAPSGYPAAPNDGLSALELATVEALIAEGRPVFRVTARISPVSGFSAARQLQLCMEAMARGELIASVPSLEEIENQRTGRELTMFVSTDLPPDRLKDELCRVDEVEEISVERLVQAGASMAQADGSPELRGSEAPAYKASGNGSGGREKFGRTVRIDLERLDNLMNLVGELVIVRTRLARIAATVARGVDESSAAGLLETANQLVRITDDLQTEVSRSRMLPIGTIFSRFPRMVRDLARKAGKRVNFIVEGQETELDRTVIEVVVDPLMHLLRNAVDHGIEPPEERLAAGKPEEGTVRLGALQEEGSIVIRVEDDGRGIDPERVKKAAVAKGLISPDAAARLTASEALDLVFAPGFSTAQEITEVSGRGVGMDVVRSNIERMNGSVKLESQPGLGTKVELRLPLTLAIIRALLVRAEDVVYAIPLTAVSEVVRLPREAIASVGGRPVVNYRDDAVPVLGLADLLRGTANLELPPGHAHVVVIGLGGRKLGLRVDAPLGNQEVVIKALSGIGATSPCISGATILDDGTVGLIVDAGAVLKAAGRATYSAKAEVSIC